jgi:hypothetical protein
MEKLNTKTMDRTAIRIKENLGIPIYFYKTIYSGCVVQSINQNQ